MVAGSYIHIQGIKKQENNAQLFFIVQQIQYIVLCCTQLRLSQFTIQIYFLYLLLL